MQFVQPAFRGDGFSNPQPIDAFTSDIANDVWSQHCSRPAIIVDKDMRLLWSNPSGAELLSSDRDIREMGGRLHLKSATGAQFRQFLDEVDDHPAAWAMLRGDERGCLVMRVTKMALGGQEAFVIAFSETKGVRRIWARFGPALGLTEAEEVVVKRLVDGANVHAVASALGVSIETVRTHVKRAYAKLGISSREEMFAEISPFRLG